MREKLSGNQSQKSMSLLKIGVILLIGSLFTLLIFNYYKKPLRDQVVNKEDLTTSQSGLMSKNEKLAWEDYANSEYGITFKIPKLLLKRDSLGENEYLYFVRFEENKFSREKGVAMGIRESDLEKEKTLLKKEMEDAGGKLSNETKLAIKDFPAERMDFKPDSQNKGLEDRSVILIERFGKVFSISTSPDQLDRLISTINFF